MYLRFLLIVFTLALLLPSSLDASPNLEVHTSKKTPTIQDPEEVFLSFNYRNFFDKVIIAYYEDGTYYLPVSEIFSSLGIANSVNTTDLSLEGFYLDPNNTYRFDFKNYRVALNNKGTYNYNASQMLVKELDFYVQLEVLQEVFELNFTVDFSNLLLRLETPKVLPIVEEFQRAERRRTQGTYEVGQNYYPLRYDRDREYLGGAFLDYSLSASMGESDNLYNYSLDLGAEVLGGDLQGSAFGIYSNDFSNLTTNNLRWRYVLRKNKTLTQIYAGQTTSDGIISRNFTGIRLTNEPIQPRYLYDTYEIEGRAEAGSEVELYYNNALYDFKRITDTGQYRFLAPLTYGTSRLQLRIYGPGGTVTEREERIQIPFTFLPKGEFSYHINAGKLDNTIFGSTAESNIVQGDFSYGISGWLTQKVGVEYFNEFTDQTPLFYSSTTARIFDEYLFNIDLAPDSFYRVSGNVVYPSSASLGLSYTYFSETGIYNPLGIQQELSGNIFVPFRLAEIPFNIRIAGNYSDDEPLDNTSYNIDLNSRINRLNMRLSYRDRVFDRFTFNPSSNAVLRTSATYLISRNANIPRYLQNTFISGSLDYNPNLNSLERAEIRASKSIFENGRFQASFSRNFLSDFNFINVGLTIDFDAFRSTTTARHVRNNASITQNIRGSIGYDDFNEDFIFSNREQVGRSGSSIRLYVDSNNSGSYEEGEQTIDDQAVRIGRAGVVSSFKNGVMRFSQLQSYHRINMEINESVIKNPLLIPKVKEFSIVTDPNQYKPINIPFYISGVIEGKVQQKTPEGLQALSGVKVYLKAEEDNYKKEMQTFSDGSFYAYEVPPGEYTLNVDSTQLQFLNARSDPPKIDFEVKALAEGDYIEGLNFKIVPLEDTDETIIADSDTTSETKPVTSDTNVYYQIQLASYASADLVRYADQRAEKILNQEFFVRYNPTTKLFALRSLPIQQKNDAVSKTQDITKSPFNEPAIVVTRDTSSSSIDLYPSFTIHIDTLNSIEQARQYANEIEEKTGVSTVVSALPNKNSYLIESSNFYSRKKAEATLESLKENPDLEKRRFSIVDSRTPEISNLYFNFFVDILGIDEITSKQYLKNINEYNILPNGAKITEKVDGGLEISGLNTWEETISLKRRLEDLFSNATVLILLEQYQ